MLLGTVINTNTHLVTFHTQHCDFNIVTDQEGFANSAGEYEHGGFLSSVDDDCACMSR